MNAVQQLSLLRVITQSYPGMSDAEIMSHYSGEAFIKLRNLAIEGHPDALPLFRQLFTIELNTWTPDDLEAAGYLFSDFENLRVDVPEGFTNLQHIIANKLEEAEIPEDITTHILEAIALGETLRVNPKG